ncbi:AraC family transcriptional regulator [Sedimentitalea sp. HM32M-2]|uniref:AraC family transcriptional regulator n=1 Tax=Sedimentitalea sp. HM32M-2 TaxID=3351566 RepID=UPI00363FA28D
MISAKALGAMPQFTFETCGQKPLERALKRSGLPHRFIERRDGYIPQHALATFIQEVGRSTGEENIGLLWAPHLTVADYGAWGDYVLSSPNLGAALVRTAKAISYHSSADLIEFQTHGARAWYGYRFGLRSHSAYSDVAFSAVGVFLSVFRHYLGPAWSPERLMIDTSKPSAGDRAEEVFGCPVHWDQPALGVLFSSKLLRTTATEAKPKATIEDIARERVGGPPKTLPHKVAAMVRLQIYEGSVSIERTAECMDIGVRTLQRGLMLDGVRFRDIVNNSRIERAKELLRHGDVSVAAVALDLGYSSPNNFSRAFNAQTGFSPSQFAESDPR